jgi:large subunit ribosomal protein L22
MEVKAVEKYIRISPKKARLVADMVRGENALKAQTMLKFVPKKAAQIIYKALTSAIANAENNAGLKKENLVISKITVDKGPSLKRFRPRSKGMASSLLKRTSHVTVVVSDLSAEEVAKPKKQAAVKTETKEVVEAPKKAATKTVKSKESK